MKKVYTLIQNEKYRLILLLDDKDFDYYMDVSVELILDRAHIILFNDSLLALRNIVKQYKICALQSELNEKCLGILLNEYYHGIYANKTNKDIVLDVHGQWVGEKYCCYLSLQYATWIYKYNGNIIMKVTPVFHRYEENAYVEKYNNFVKEYRDLFREIISSRQLKDLKKIILELYNILNTVV